MIIKRVRLVSLIAIVLLVTTIGVCQECQKLRGASAEDKVSYLESIKGRADEDCITYAIEWLGGNKFEPAIPVLVKFLNFYRHPSGWEAATNSMHTSTYPAASALENIGKSALPSVLNVLKLDSAQQISRDNAVEVWMVVHGADVVNAVAELKRSADEVDDIKAKQRLLSAVSAALKWCGSSDKSSCEQAATKKYE
jgi:hypothetical protein